MRVGSTNVLYVAGDAVSGCSVASTVRVLLERGCVVRVAVDANYLGRCRDRLEQLSREHPSVQWELVPTAPFDAWSNLGRQLYIALDRLRVGPAMADSSTTAASATPVVGGVLGRFLARSRPGRWLFERLLGACELAVPRNATIDAKVRGHNPDIVLIADVAPCSPGVDCARSARALGVPAVVCTGPAEVALLALDTVPRRPPRGRVWWAPLMRRALARHAQRYAHTPSARMEKAARDERIKSARLAAARARKSEARAVKLQRAEATTRRRQLSAAKHENEARAYERYVKVREWANEMRESNDDAVAVSPSEQRMRDALAHLWHAEPATIATLRHCCGPISGSRAADYAPPSFEVKDRVRRGIVSLRRWVGDDLLVPEPDALGGFGCSVGTGCYNADTVRFFNSLVALRDAAVLGAFERPSRRHLVWEIGGGWGGFAYQFKTICPNVTYVITALPELLLVSAVYLMTLIPEARVRFYRAATAGELWWNWEDVDFIFAPEPTLEHCRPPRLDLTLDLAALAEMTPPRVRAHVHTAYEVGSRYLYSLRADGGGDDATSVVRRAIEQWYWPHPVPPRIEAAEEKKYAAGNAWSDASYTHLVGWRRIHA